MKPDRPKLTVDVKIYSNNFTEFIRLFYDSFSLLLGKFTKKNDNQTSPEKKVSKDSLESLHSRLIK